MQFNNTIKVEAAGAGKTYGICKDAINIVGTSHTGKRVLVLSYTNRGVDAIKTEIKKQNCGVLCNKIDVFSWYRFLLGDMIKPYQSVMYGINEIKSLDFSDVYGKINYKKAGTKERYINSNKDVKSNVAGELALLLNSRSEGMVIRRIVDIYDHIFIDEVQDMAGYDLNIIETLMKSDVSVTCVGDSKQATFKTNNSVKNKKVTGSNVWDFFAPLIKADVVKIERNLNSRRFNQELCNFSNLVYPNENSISTIMQETTEHDGVYLIEKKDIQKYHQHFNPVVLKYDKKTKTDGFISYNFGECKGLTFARIIIYPNGPFKEFLVNGKKLKAPQKYYVAATRAKYSIAFVCESFPKETAILQEYFLKLGDETLRLLKYVCDGNSKN